MATGIKVADLFARLGVEVDQRQIAGANVAIRRLRDEVGGLRGVDPGPWAKRWSQGLAGLRTAVAGVAVGLGVGIGAAIYKGVKLNATIEDTKNQVAGMLALSKKTDLADQIGPANELYENLQRRAASLPGTTAEYAQMLGAITQPVTSAGLGLQDLEDLTVNAVVAAKALGEQWDVAARDIGQALRGQLGADDPFIGKLLATIGYEGDAGRERFKALSKKRRAEVVKEALTQKQLAQLAERQGKSLSGRLSTLQDAAAQFLGRIARGLFDALGPTIDRTLAWLEQNQESVQGFASTVGSVIAGAFSAIGAVIGWLIDHGDVARALLLGLAGLGATMAAAWVVAAAPVIAVVAALTAVAYAVIKLHKHWRQVAAFFKTSIRGVGMALAAVGRGIAAPFIAAWNYVTAGFNAMVSGFHQLAQAMAAPFVWVFDTIRGIFVGFLNFFVRSINWLIDKVNWVASKADWLPGIDVGRIDRIEEFGSGPTRTPAPSSRATTNNVSTTINVSGVSDPKAAAAEADRRFSENFATALRLSEEG